MTNLDEFFASEQKQQYCMLPFWKRITILLAGPFMNLLYAMIVFVIIYSIIGVDVQMQSGEVVHYVLGAVRCHRGWVQVHRHGGGSYLGPVQPRNGG